MYGVDTRSTAEIELLTEELGAAAILERAGTALSSQAVGPKLEWVYRHEPDVFARAAQWFGSNSYIAAKLTGEYAIDHHTASQCDPSTPPETSSGIPNGRNGFADTCACPG